MSKVLFICHANVGRSQIAEAYHNYLTNSKDAVSAGNDPEAPGKYKRMSLSVLQIMAEDDAPMRGHFVKLVTQKMIDLCDKMFILCEPEKCLDFVINSDKPKEFWDIKDPHKVSLDEMRLIRDQIKEKVLEII